MKKKLNLTERDIKNILRSEIQNVINENECPFPNSAVKQPLYHCGKHLNQEDFNDVIWFSDKPIDHFGEAHRYYVNIENPLVINCQGAGWTDKLWWECCDEDGVANEDPNSERLTNIAPAEIWKYAQEEGSDESEYGDIPHMVLNGMFGGKYKSVILKDIGETPNCSVIVNDYVVFSMDDVMMID